MMDVKILCASTRGDYMVVTNGTVRVYIDVVENDRKTTIGLDNDGLIALIDTLLKRLVDVRMPLTRLALQSLKGKAREDAERKVMKGKKK